MGEKRWEHFCHQADIGVRGRGHSIEQAFEQAAVALVAVIADNEKIDQSRTVSVTCQADDPELLLVDWLNALIYQMDTRKMLFSRFEVSIKETRLKANAWGEPLDIDKHHPVVEVKAATYNCLKVARSETGLWVAQCVVDV